jgi:hypothetical protein
MNWILPLLSPSFWFNTQTVPFMPWLGRFLPIFLGVFVLAGIGFSIYPRVVKLEKDLRRLWKRLAGCLGWAGFAGLVLYFFQWQYVPFLSMRVLWLFWLGGFGYWGYEIWHDHFHILPAQRAKDLERAEYEKWLPKPRGRQGRRG